MPPPRRRLLVASDQDRADPGVESVAQTDALRFAQRVFVQRFARELQERTIHIRREPSAGENVRAVTLFLGRDVMEPPGRILLADVKRGLESRGSPNLVGQGHVPRPELPPWRHH